MSGAFYAPPSLSVACPSPRLLSASAASSRRGGARSHRRSGNRIRPAQDIHPTVLALAIQQEQSRKALRSAPSTSDTFTDAASADPAAGGGSGANGITFTPQYMHLTQQCARRLSDRQFYRDYVDDKHHAFVARLPVAPILADGAVLSSSLVALWQDAVVKGQQRQFEVDVSLAQANAQHPSVAGAIAARVLRSQRQQDRAAVHREAAERNRIRTQLLVRVHEASQAPPSVRRLARTAETLQQFSEPPSRADTQQQEEQLEQQQQQQQGEGEGKHGQHAQKQSFSTIEHQEFKTTGLDASSGVARTQFQRGGLDVYVNNPSPHSHSSSRTPSSPQTAAGGRTEVNDGDDELAAYARALRARAAQAAEMCSRATRSPSRSPSPASSSSSPRRRRRREQEEGDDDDDVVLESRDGVARDSNDAGIAPAIPSHYVQFGLAKQATSHTESSSTSSTTSLNANTNTHAGEQQVLSQRASLDCAETHRVSSRGGESGGGGGSGGAVPVESAAAAYANLSKEFDHLLSVKYNPRRRLLPPLQPVGPALASAAAALASSPSPPGAAFGTSSAGSTMIVEAVGSSSNPHSRSGHVTRSFETHDRDRYHSHYNHDHDYHHHEDVDVDDDGFSSADGPNRLSMSALQHLSHRRMHVEEIQKRSMEPWYRRVSDEEAYRRHKAMVSPYEVFTDPRWPAPFQIRRAATAAAGETPRTLQTPRPGMVPVRTTATHADGTTAAAAAASGGGGNGGRACNRDVDDVRWERLKTTAALLATAQQRQEQQKQQQQQQHWQQESTSNNLCSDSDRHQPPTSAPISKKDPRMAALARLVLPKMPPASTSSASSSSSSPYSSFIPVPRPSILRATAASASHFPATQQRDEPPVLRTLQRRFAATQQQQQQQRLPTLKRSGPGESAGEGLVNRCEVTNTSNNTATAGTAGAAGLPIFIPKSSHHHHHQQQQQYHQGGAEMQDEWVKIL